MEQHHNQRIHPEMGQTSDHRFAEHLSDPQIKEQLDRYLCRDNRKIQKTATINFEGNHYEVDPALPGNRITLYYDPTHPERIQIYYERTCYADAEPTNLKWDHHSGVAKRPEEERSSTDINDLVLLIRQQQSSETIPTGSNAVVANLERLITMDLCEHFGLNQMSFTRHIAPGNLYPSAPFIGCTARLQFIVDHRVFGVITGEVEVGKSNGR